MATFYRSKREARLAKIREIIDTYGPVITTVTIGLLTGLFTFLSSLTDDGPVSDRILQNQAIGYLFIILFGPGAIYYGFAKMVEILRLPHDMGTVIGAGLVASLIMLCLAEVLCRIVGVESPLFFYLDVLWPSFGPP